MAVEPQHERIKNEYDEIIAQLSNPELVSELDKFEALSRKKNKLEKIIAKYDELSALDRKIEESNAILRAPEDAELTALAKQELKDGKEEKACIEAGLKKLLLEKDGREGAPAPDAIIIEIRAGVGGEEAALFAVDLFNMYAKFAQSRGWKQKLLNSSATEIGGYKEIVFEVAGRGTWEILRHEGGVHRVQRIPKTEKGGRVHTSTCSVVVLPKPKKAQLQIRPDDLRIETFRASGPGGQYVNRRESAVRITHIPSGISVASQTERSQLQNKENAMTILEARLLTRLRAEEEERLAGARKSQAGQSKRAEKIRTYNFPQDRVTDHRLKKSWHNIDNIMEGKLDLIAKAVKNGENPAGY